MLPAFATMPPLEIPAEAVYRSTFSNSANLGTTYSFTVNIGSEEKADRYVIVAIKLGIFGAVSFSSVTINGVSATLLVQQAPSNNSGRIGYFISSAPVPSGSTATIQVVASTSLSWCGGDCFTVTGLKNTVPVATYTENSADEEVHTLSSVVIERGGFGLYTTTTGNVNVPSAWTNAVEVTDNQLGDTNDRVSSAIGDTSGDVSVNTGPSVERHITIGISMR